MLVILASRSGTERLFVIKMGSLIILFKNARFRGLDQLLPNEQS